MAEQENQSTDEAIKERQEQVAAEAAKDKAADKVVPKTLRRRSIYIVEKEFIHKRKHIVGSLFRPRRFPRLRPRRLRDLVADGFVRLATEEERRAIKALPGVRMNPVAPPDDGIKDVGGGWHEVTVGGETEKVRGSENAEERFAELSN